jgi:hypothetical protein
MTESISSILASVLGVSWTARSHPRHANVGTIRNTQPSRPGPHAQFETALLCEAKIPRVITVSATELIIYNPTNYQVV